MGHSLIIVLPNEDRIALPEDCRSSEDIKSYLEKQTGHPVSIQRLYLEGQEVTGHDTLTAMSNDSEIDLFLQLGPEMLVCRSGLAELLKTRKTEVFIPRRSLHQSRDIDAFKGNPHIKLGTEPEKQQKVAEPFFLAFERNREARRRQLRRIRTQLDLGPVVFSTFNSGYRELLANWAASCDRNKIACRDFTLLFPADEQADAFARNLGFRTYFDGGSYGDLPAEAAECFGDLTFRKMLFAKLGMTVDMLEMDGDFLRQDVDLVWNRDPREDLRRRLDDNCLDMEFMYDGPNPICQPLHYNSGFIFIRANAFTRHMWQVVFKNYGFILRAGGEQPAINTVAHCLRERGLRVDQLPEEDYVNGHLISLALDGEQPLPKDASVIHASWTSNIKLKIDHMKKFGLWYL